MDKEILEREYNGAFVAALQDYGASCKKLREVCVSILTSILKNAPGEKIDFNDYDDVNPTICYDGGRHPEYASNMFSDVWGMKLQRGKIVFEIDEDDSYEIDKVPVEDIAALVDTFVPVLLDSEE